MRQLDKLGMAYEPLEAGPELGCTRFGCSW